MSDQPTMKVKFLPSGEEHEIQFNETILHLAQRKDIQIHSVCNGIPTCAECRIQLKEGETHVLPPSAKEIDLIGTAHYVDQSRLACQLRCFGDVTVDLGEQLEKDKQAPKGPAGPVSRSQGEESFAVKGNLIDQEYQEQETLLKEDGKGTSGKMGQDFYQSGNKSRGKKRSSRGRKDGQRGDQRSAQGGSGKKTSSTNEAQGAENTGKKKRRRRRKPKPGGGSASSENREK